MSEHFLSGEKVRVEFPDGAWVEVKEELTQADQDFIMSQLARLEVGVTEKDDQQEKEKDQKGKYQKVELNLGHLALLERSIMAWSFPEPVTRENISALRQRYRVKLLAEVDRLNNAALEWSRKN